MTIVDMVALALDNLRRAKLRTALTTLGVVIGIGALTSMIAFGTGMQKNITDAFKTGDLFTSMFITSRAIDAEELSGGDPDDIVNAIRGPASSLTDSTLAAVRQIPGVEIAFPEISFPVRVRMGENEARTTLRALPADMRLFKPYSKLAFGEFFTDDSSRSLVIGSDALKRMKLVVRDPKVAVALTKEDSLKGVRVVEGDSLIGRTIEIVSVALDASQLAGSPLLGLPGMGRMPVSESSTEFRIAGIIRTSTAFSNPELKGGVIVPLRAAEAIPRLGFSSVWDLLGGGGHGTYNSIYVRAKSMTDVAGARAKIEKMGLHVFSFSDQLGEIRRGFLIADSILGAIGTIALVVAALGIANTMVMSILERTREIGIMKAIGASDGEIKLIFFVEAATIGTVGAILGLGLGWLVTRAANLVANARILPQGEPGLNLFYFPLWLILGAIGFSVVISLVAGLYPAVRAAGVDPVEALRHD
jgi:ABC-type antimicrobial peptide transport system permease subunit